MTTQTNSPINLDRLIDAARNQFSEADITLAATRALEGLPKSTTRKKANLTLGAFGRYALGLVGLVIASLLVGPHWFSDSSGAALAKALRWFDSYSNMYVHFIMPPMDGMQPSVETWRDRSGYERQRLVMGEFESTTIFDTSNAIAYTLLDEKHFTKRALTKEEIAAGSTPGAVFLEGLISFEGEAVPLNEERIEDERPLQGMKLISDEVPPVERILWVDRETKMPVRFIVDAPELGEHVFEMDFNRDLPDDFFEVPDGYTELQDEDFLQE